MITQQQRSDIVLAAVNCEHQIDADCIRLYRDPTKAGSALSQMVDRVVAAIEQGAQPGADVVPTMGAADPLYEKAVAIVRTHKVGSVSLVQRHLAIGYNRAHQMLEAMIGTVIAEAPPTKKLISAAPQPQQEQSK